MYQEKVHKLSCKCTQINLLRDLLAIVKEVEFICLMKPNTTMSIHHKQYTEKFDKGEQIWKIFEKIINNSKELLVAFKEHSFHWETQ
jgi:hypothetical protein